MKKLIALGAIIALAACGRDEPETADIKIFWMPGCPHCHNAKEFFATKLPHATVDKTDVTASDANRQKFFRALESCNLTSRGVPLIILTGEDGRPECIQGYAPEVGEMIYTRLKLDVEQGVLVKEVVETEE